MTSKCPHHRAFHPECRVCNPLRKQDVVDRPLLGFAPLIRRTVRRSERRHVTWE